MRLRALGVLLGRSVEKSVSRKPAGPVQDRHPS
jgi:hypothetical protein